MRFVPPRHWFRFRLSTILMLTTIAALAVAQYASIRRSLELEARNRELQAVNSKLRAEAGYLEVDEPKKAVVLRLSELDELTWRWKVWLPSGKWRVGWETRRIPNHGVPNGSNAGSIEGGREILATATVRNGSDGKWDFRAQVDDSQVGNTLQESHGLVKPVTDDRPINRSVEIAGNKLQESFDPNKPVVLIRLRTHEMVATPAGGWTSKDSARGSDGVMVWLYRVQ